ncbi:MAG TPA: GNAT family N-acetyltransferase, partial [Alteraurantiacibacter sp.]
IDGAIRDHYWAIEMGGELAGFFMLRGLDTGYAKPSFGIFVAEHWSGRGLAAAALEYSKAWCTEHGVSTMMLKVAPDNAAARRIYQDAGFVPVGTCPDTGHAIHEWRSDRS